MNKKQTLIPIDQFTNLNLQVGDEFYSHIYKNEFRVLAQCEDQVGDVYFDTLCIKNGDPNLWGTHQGRPCVFYPVALQENYSLIIYE